jgi:diaminopimelate decarboxylase
VQQRRELLAQIADRYGTPCFVYFMHDVQRRVDALRAAFDGMFEISYAMKCNPNAALLTRMCKLVDTLDVSSRGELARGVEAGFAPAQISFTGPAKQRLCLERSLEHAIGEVVLESEREARLLSELALARGTVQPVLLRIAPHKVPKGFGSHMAGKPCQFGVDEEDLALALSALRGLRGISLRGFHIYSGTQSLKADAIAENYGIFVDLFQRAATLAELAPERLIFGSGLGVRYHDGDAELDLMRVAAQTLPLLRALKSEPRFARTQLTLETGRYLVGEAGVYLTRVVNRKHSRGSEIATFDGGLNHHLAATGHLGMVIHKPYRMFKLGEQGALASYDLYGPLCTSIDVLGRGVKLPGLAVDDVLAIESSGAYGPSASPAGFISHDPARELLVERDTQGRETIIASE